jgi:photosystem II stability/assembly factor-like uncharacterized protein
LVGSTHDGGLHWTFSGESVNTNARAGGLFPMAGRIVFSSPNNGWMVVGMDKEAGSNGSAPPRDVLLVTRDGGASWLDQQLPVTPSGDFRIETPVFFGQHGIIVLDGSPPSLPALLVSSDGGATWSERSVPWDTTWAIGFVDLNHGWAVAGLSSQFAKPQNSFSPVPNVALPLYHTDDGGQTWRSVKTTLLLDTTAGRLTSFSFVDQKIAFATRYGGSGPSEVLKTTDGGLSWTRVE